MDKIKDVLQGINLKSIPNQKIYSEPEEIKEPTKEEKRANYLLKYGGITDLRHTFTNMRKPQGFDKTYNAFIELAGGKASWWMLLVYGGSGNGKSLCCEATVITLYDKGILALREKWSDIVRFRLRASFNDRAELSYEEQFKRLRARPTLIIDDVGMGSTGGNWEWGELEDIVDYRLEHQLFTIITTNLDLKEIPPRIVSRFRDSKRCRLICDEAPDQRPMEANNGR